jgi:hypothetical protein
MIKKINEDIFNEKTQNSDRELFDVDGFRLIDGDRFTKENELEQSYFLFDDIKKNIYELTLKQAYDLLSLYADKEVEESVLCEDIEGMINK